MVQAVLVDGLKMGPIGFPETGDYQYTLRNIPEKRRSQLSSHPKCIGISEAVTGM
jgi:hypothetical protein